MSAPLQSQSEICRDILTVAEAAELMRCSIDVVYEMVRRNEIPHGRLGRSIRFHRRALERYLGWSGPDDAATECEEGPPRRASQKQSPVGTTSTLAVSAHNPGSEQLTRKGTVIRYGRASRQNR